MKVSAAKRHRRKTRRNRKAQIKHGRNAAPSHKGKSGRTGSMHAKKLRSRRPK